MSKWADYGISAVRFNTARTHIDKVQVRPDNGDTIGSPSEHTRVDVVDGIKRGTTYVTIFKDNDDKWKKGQPVYVVTINGKQYLKTVDNGKAVDNLDNLPEF